MPIRVGSGTAVGISVLRDALIAAGHRVTLVAPAPRTRHWSVASRLLFDYRAREAVRDFRPDVVVAFDLDGVFLPRSNLPHVAASKGVLADEARFERGAARLRLRLESLFERSHVRRAARLITTSAYSAARIEACYGRSRRETRIVPEPIDLKRWDAALATTTPRTERGPKPTTPTILCVAHLYRRKDVATLLRAVACSTTRPLLRVVGVGPEREALVRLARSLRLESRVSFPGHLPFAELAAAYGAADLFALPSRQEGFGIVYLEAMAAALPIVAARAGATPELVADGECGVLVPPGDVHALAAALDRLLLDPDERYRLGSAGRQRVARYDSARIAREFLDAIAAV